MDISQLEIKEYKNYKEICTVLNEQKTGKSRQLQLKDWERYFKCEKDGHKFVIKEIYNIPKEKIDSRVDGNNWANFPEYMPGREYNKKIGVYYILKDNDIYIGSTIVGFRERFRQHRDKSNLLKTKKMLRTGGVFDILWVSDVVDEYLIRQIEDIYIEYFKKDDRFNVINKNKAWSFTEIKPKKLKKAKNKYRNIKVLKKDFDLALKLLKQNNIFIK